MKSDKGTIFLAIASLALIVLLIALAAAVVTGPNRQEAGSPPLSGYSGGNEASLSGPASNGPEPARPVMKTSYYPGFVTKYRLSFAPICYDMYGRSFMGRELTLNDDGTVTLVVDFSTATSETLQRTFTGGSWYKVTGKGHEIYLNLDEDYVNDHYSGIYSGFQLLTDKVVDIGMDGTDSFEIDYMWAHSMSNYNNWDAGYATMSASTEVLVPYIDSCIPADVARPYIEKGYTAAQAVPYIAYIMPVETAEYFAKLGIPLDLCGPYYAAGVPQDDIMTYLDAGCTIDEVLPYFRAGVPASDTIAYLNAGVTYDKARPYIDARAPAGNAAPYAASQFTSDRCLPFINAGISISKAKPFLLFGIPADQAVVYINNSINASTAKPYADAGVPAEKAVEEIKQGIPPAL
ncbi:MAG: hypothetical protein WBZ29_03945 [Methanocella sp.]